MKWKLAIAIIVLSIGSSFAQEAEEKESVFQNLIAVEDKVYHFIQLSSGITGREPIFGVQYKRVRHENVYYFSLTHGFSTNVCWTQLNGENLMQSNIELHISSYPYTGTFRLGLGFDVQTNLSDQNYMSFYPSFGYDLGFAEISYIYLINGEKAAVLPDHRIRIAIGLPFKTKVGWN